VTRQRIVVVAGVLATILLVGAGVGALLLGSRGPALSEPATIAIQEGERLPEIARRLAAQGLLRWPTLFVAWARLTGRDRSIRWGEFRIPEPLSPRELLARITGPPDSLHAVVIPEGLTVHAVVARLAAAGLGSAETFQALLADPQFLAVEGLPPEGPEGYLFPDTYAFPAATPPDRVLRTMIRRFREVFTAELQERAARLGLTPHQAVTLASLVEEETAVPEERPLVAAVFLNRFHRGMPLQADPTVLYGRTDGDRRIRRSDLARPTSHNTYTMPGLPPTPIANPGRAALEAACAPADVPYLYFVARGDGSHEFNVDLDKHNEAVARLRGVERALRQ
jgi:UPF0755 protein